VLPEFLEFGAAAFGGETPAQGGFVAEAKRIVEIGGAGQGSIPALFSLGGDIDGGGFRDEFGRGL